MRLNEENLWEEILAAFVKFNNRTNSCSFKELTIKIKDYPNLENNKINSRDFKSPYLDQDDLVGGNLYYWIHQSTSVLWEINHQENEIIIYQKTIEKLGNRFATLLKVDKDSAIKSVLKMCLTFAGNDYLNRQFMSLKKTDVSQFFASKEIDYQIVALFNEHFRAKMK